MKLLIRNLARTTTKEELKQCFEEFGTVQACDLVLDKKTGGSKGFAFVVMSKPGDAKAAVKNLNNKDIGGSKIRVKKATKKKAAPIVPKPPSAGSIEPIPHQPNKSKKR
jgi:RNA recognition motif-containing protein